MANKVAVEVVIDTQIEAFEIFDMQKVHVDVIEIVLVEKVYDLAVISNLCFV